MIASPDKAITVIPKMRTFFIFLIIPPIKIAFYYHIEIYRDKQLHH